jgi:hypothetical protein
MLILLRLQAEAFGAAEYDEPGNRYHRGFWTRLCWYALGLALLWAIYLVHPQPHDVLFLVVGNHVDVFAFGLSLAAVGAVQAAIFAWFRYGGLRLPAPSAYPGAALNSVLPRPSSTRRHSGAFFRACCSPSACPTAAPSWSRP